MRVRVGLAPILGVGLLVTGCTSVIGLGVVAGVGAAAVLASDCPNLVDITVRDGVTGGRTCEATVIATLGDESQSIAPCYHAHLADGTWQIRASYPGRADEVSTVVVSRQGKCVHTVQTVELWLRPAGRSEPTVVQPSPPLPAPPPPPTAAPPAAPSAPSAAPPVVPSAAPSGSPAPPTKGFPAGPGP
jgi:hypothetical protein